MATVKVKFRPSTVEGGYGTIYYQIIHNRVARQIASSFKVRAGDWDFRRSAVVTSGRKQPDPSLRAVRDGVRQDVERISRIIRCLEAKGIVYCTDDIVEELRNYGKDYTIFSYMEGVIAQLRQMGRDGTAQNYRSALNSLRRFMKDADIMLDCITASLMENYEAWQHSQGNCPNTSSFYMRILRAVYKRAVEEGIIEDRKPFRRVYTGVDRTVKRALPLNTIRKIKDLDLSAKPRLDLARDMFLLSFYFRGMSFVDMAFLRKSDLRDGELTYRRRKTSQLLTIAWTQEMQRILDKYPANESEYLLPIITRRGLNERCAYRNAGYRLNHYFKQIGALVGASDNWRWSFYQARHSWASIARERGVPLSVISDGMGHDNERTTRIYLASLETSVVDKANDYIISLLQ